MPQEPQKWQGTAKGPLPTTNKEVRYSLITQPDQDQAEKSVRATFSVQVLEFNTGPVNTLPFLPNIFLLHSLVVSITARL